MSSRLTLLRRGLLVGLLLLVLHLPAFAQSVNLTKALGAGTPDPVPAGQEFDYIIGYTFSSTTADFYGATVEDVLPPGLVYAGSYTPSVHVVGVSTPADGSGGPVVFTMVSPLPAGSSGTLAIRVRFPLGTTTNGLTATNITTGSASFGSPGGPTVGGSSPPVLISALAGCNWVASSTVPATAVFGQNVTNVVGLYRPTPNLGTLNILSGNLTNVLPVGVLPSDVVSYGPGGTLSGTGLPGSPVTLVWAVPNNTPAVGAGGSPVFTRNVVLRYDPTRFSNPQTVSGTLTAGLNLFGGTTCTPTAISSTTVSGSADAVVGKGATPVTVPTNTPFYWALTATNTGNVALDNFTLNDPLPQSFALSDIQLPNVANGPGGNFITIRYATSASPTLQTWPGGPYPADGSGLAVSALSLAPGVYVSRVQFEMGTVGAGFSFTSPIRLNGVLLATGWGASPPTLTPGNLVSNTNTLSATFAASPAFPDRQAIAAVTVAADSPSATVTKDRSTGSVALGQDFYFTLFATNTGNVVLTNLTLDDPLPQNFELRSIQLPTAINGPGGNFIAVRYATSANATLQPWPGSPFPAGTSPLLTVSTLSLAPGEYVSRVVIEFATAPVNFSTGTGNNRIRLNGVLLATGWGTPPTTITTGSSVTNTVSLSGTSQAGGVSGSGSRTVTVAAPNPNATTSKGRSVASVTPNTQSFYWTLDADNTGNVALTGFTLDDPLPQNFALSAIRLPTVNNGPGGNFITVRYATSSSATLQVWPGSPFAAVTDTLPVSALGLAPGAYVSRVVFEFGDVAWNFGINTAIRLEGVLLSTGWLDGQEISEGSSVTNTVTLNTSELPARTSSIAVDVLAGLNGRIIKDRSTSTATVNGSSVYWTLLATNLSNVAVDSFRIGDALPGHFNLTSVRLPAFTPSSGITVNLFYVRSDTGATNLWPGSPFASGTTTLNVSSLGLPSGVAVARVTFDFGTVPAGWRISTAARLNGTFVSPAWDNPASVITVSTSICNTATLNATFSGSPAFPERSAQSCISVAPAAVRPASAKTIISSGTYVPGSEITYRVETRNAADAGTVMINPVAMDLLPATVEFVGGSFTFLTAPADNTAGATEPALEILPNYNSSGRLLLRWTYTNHFAPNTFSAVTFKVRVKPGTANGTTITNVSYVGVDPSQQWGSVSYPNPSGPDTPDLDGDGNTTEVFGQSPTETANTAVIGASATLESSKFVRGALDTAYSRFPEFGFTVPGGAVDYRIILFNNGSVPVTNIVLLDILPSIGDVGVIDPQPRGSQWTPLLTAPIDVLVNGLPVPGTVVEYSTSANPCRPEVVPSGPPGCTPPGWSPAPPVPISATRAFRVIFPPTYELAASAVMRVDISMVAPYSFVPGSIAWNSFAYRATPASPGLPELAAEPIKVGVSAIPPYSVGDYVWLDENSDGYQDAGEPGIPNVRVNFYNNSGALVTSTLTDAHGRYLFSDLILDSGYVRVDETTLPAGMTQTPPANLPQANFGNQDQSTGLDDYGYFVRVLTGIPNLTGDFGYNWNPAPDVLSPSGSPPGSLGDRVWLDFNGNGRQDPDELGVRGATVQIFTAGADGLFGTGDDQPGATRDTDANGNYMFDNLPAGAYVVRVVNDTGANYPILGPTYNQTGDPDHFGTTGFNNDGETTIPIVLGPGDVFLNADFGYRPTSGVTLGSLGDLVWLDINSSSNSVPDSPSERGIAGVTVSLIRDVNGDGVWDSGEPIIATTTTDAVGNYLFQGLPLGDEGDGLPGDAHYLVWVNDTADHLANLVPTYDNSGPINSLGAATLSPGTPEDLTVDFSFKPMTQPGAPAVTTAVLGDRVWFDTNRDGIQDPSESGIPGVLMELLDGSGNVIALAVTDPAGYYFFAGLDPAAAYSVVVAAANFLPGAVLAGTENTFDADGGLPGRSTVNFALSDGPNDPDGTRNFINLGQDFGYAAPAGVSGSLGNQIWVDANADGIRNPDGADGIPGTDDDEPALPGITVDLYRDLNLNGKVDPGEPQIAATITDASGQYLFTGLPLTDGLYDPQVYASDPDAAYVVDVSDWLGVLMGWWHSLGNQSQTSNDTSKTDPWAVTLTQTVPEVLTADFGYYVEPAAVGNYVWEDLNGNGLQDAGEPGIDGVLMQNQITYPDGTITILKTLTGDDPDTSAVEQGWYRFSNLLQDEHYNGVNMAPTPAFEISVLTAAGTVPLNGLVVTLLNQGSDPKVDADNPDGTAGFPIKGITDMQAFADPNLEPMPASYDFGYLRAMSLGNRVWFDVNNNGQFDSGEAVIPGVKVELLAAPSGSVITTAFTDANGYYRFDGLYPGDYQVSIVAENWTGINDSPGGTLDGTKPLAACNSSTGNADATATSGPGAVNGTDHGVDSTTPATTGVTSLVVTLGPGNQPTGDFDSGATGAGGHGPNGDAYDNLALDFGFYRLSVGNLVFSDVNVDGYFNAGDAGINGVRVELYDGASLVAVTTTAGGGAYAFTGETDAGGALTGNPLLPGVNYTVQIPASQPVLAGFYSTHDTAGTPNPNGGVDNDDNVVGMTPAAVLLGTPAFTLAAGVGAASGTIVTPANGLTDQPTIDLGLAPTSSLVAFGNLVWLDANADGRLDSGEAGITNVVVELYTAGQTPGTDAPVQTQLTDGDGRFYFDMLPAGSYFTHIPATQFQAGAPLTNLVSSPGAGTGAANDENVDENGLDTSNPSASGISSAVFPLTAGTGPLGENAQNYAGSLPDANTTFTVDFGFARTFSLGNRVFADNGAGGGGANNGIQDGTEPGLAGVVIRLYAADASGNPTGSLLDTQTSDSEGWYRFDGLVAGSYVPVVDVTASGAVLTGLASSTGASTDTTITGDLRDHGLDTPLDSGSVLPGGIAGAAVTVGAGLQPTGEATGSGAGAHGPSGDPGDNLTDDFGFAPGFSLGNRVFADNGAGGGVANNGMQDGNEPGLAGVVVTLFAADVNGHPTGSMLQSTNTDADGWYRFDALASGTYVPVVDVVGSGAVLALMTSSTGYTTNTTITGDLRDHGQDTPLDGLSVLPGGIAGVAVTLGAGLQPLGEATSTGAGAHGPGGDGADNLVSDFGFVSCSCVDGYVYVDSVMAGSTVGVYDPGVDTPLPFITVYVLDSLGGLVVTQTDTNGYFKAYVPPGMTRVDVDQFDPDFPPGLVLTSLPDGQNPSIVNVAPCDCARDNTGYLRYSPTLVSILSVTARADAGVVTVQWVTAAEVGTVAYDLQRQLPDGSWLTANAEPVFAWNALSGAVYDVRDATAQARQAYQYQIVEYLENGQTKAHGPYEVTVSGEPGTAVAITSCSLAGGQLRLTWSGETGTRYLLEHATSLGAEASWTEVPLATPEQNSAVVPVTGAAGYFRVYRLP
jgi:uncharacterized repeat protein (TIGR01451 family)